MRDSLHPKGVCSRDFFFNFGKRCKIQTSKTNRKSYVAYQVAPYWLHDTVVEYRSVTGKLSLFYARARAAADG